FYGVPVAVHVLEYLVLLIRRSQLYAVTRREGSLLLYDVFLYGKRRADGRFPLLSQYVLACHGVFLTRGGEGLLVGALGRLCYVVLFVVVLLLSVRHGLSSGHVPSMVVERFRIAGVPVAAHQFVYRANLHFNASLFGVLSYVFSL